MVMEYAEEGSLRNLLNNNFINITWEDKILNLFFIAFEFAMIHKAGLMYKDFHSGNLVNNSKSYSQITDFGLCKPITENDPENVYGVIPYIAPEVLNSKKYTDKSDIYSFGMIMLEIFTSYPPYYNIPHDKDLVLKILGGYKPEIRCEIPQLLKDIMEKCWEIEPQDRPTAKELQVQFENLSRDYYDGHNSEIRKQVKAVEKLNMNFKQYDPSEMHPEAIYTSRHLPFLKPKKFEDNVHGKYLYF